MNKFLVSEQRYHDSVAVKFAETRVIDYIWEIPEELFILKDKFFINKTVVDMGCGPSVSVKRIVTAETLKKSEYIGIDISREMLKIAKRNIPFGMFICSDISDVKLDNNSVDTILSIGSLHHVENKIITLKKWIELLKKNGYLLLREPLYESLKKGEGASQNEEGIKLNEIINFLSKESNIKVNKLIFFGSPVFHFFNKVLSKVLGKLWLNTKFLWYPVLIFDICLSTLLKKIYASFNVDSCIIIAQKV